MNPQTVGKKKASLNDTSHRYRKATLHAIPIPPCFEGRLVGLKGLKGLQRFRAFVFSETLWPGVLGGNLYFSMSLPPQNTSSSSVSDKLLCGDETELRAKRVWLLINVMALTWAFFSIFLFLRGYTQASCFCVIQLSLTGLLRVYFRKTSDYCRLMNAFLLTSGTGILLVATSDPALGLTVFFYPISILVASQLFGVRQATYWFVASLVNFLIYYLAVYGIHATFHDHLDGLLLSLGTAFCSYFCCQQAEAYYRKKTKGLIDLSESLQKKSEVLHDLATTDSLTKLTNRFQFQNLLASHVQLASSDELLLFLVDMDGFKDVNDTMGHAAGDAILIEIGVRLLDSFGDRAEVSRLGGDEFCLLFVGDEYVRNAESIGREIHDLLTEGYALRDLKVVLGASIGYATYPEDARTKDALLAFADTAMYQAKKDRLQVARYESVMTEALVEQRTLNDQLAEALERGEFFLVYQPQVENSAGRIIGAEALLRWRHNGEVISPARFIPLLERSGLIIKVGDWVVQEACRQLSEWQQNGLDTRLAVNISAIQFQDCNFVERVTAHLNKQNIDPSKFELEITEGVLVENVDTVAIKLQRMHELGLKISVDDFGTGYSSLSYLRQFPIDKLKIDRAFVKDIPHADDGVIASSIIALSASLEMQVIAEGVETLEQLDVLANFGCDQYQGYFFSRPLPADEFEKLLEEARSADAVSVRS